ncbi:hypothetical protein ASD63_20540 [Ensifer sp. Root558]|nr:hypothetical protein ASD63_20540 [Ensifer sp. Root558]
MSGVVMRVVESDIVLDGRVVDETVDRIARHLGSAGDGCGPIAEIEHPRFDPPVSQRQVLQSLPVAAKC